MDQCLVRKTFHRFCLATFGEVALRRDISEVNASWTLGMWVFFKRIYAFKYGKQALCGKCAFPGTKTEFVNICL